MKSISIKVLLILLFGFYLHAQDSHTTETGECRQCHFCDKPTKENPCLRPCTRISQRNAAQYQDQLPDVLVMDILSEIYVPVVFSHKYHAEMADMSGGCDVCHHQNGTIDKCQPCHPPSVKRAN